MWHIYKETKEVSGENGIKHIQFKFFHEQVKADYEKSFKEHGEGMSSEFLFTLPIQDLYALVISLNKADKQGLFNEVKSLCTDLEGK